MVPLSMEEAKKLLKKNPSDPHANFSIANVFLKDKDYKRALKHFHLTLMNYPRLASDIMVSFEEHILQNIEDIEARLALVDFLVLSGDVDSAILELEDLVELSPESSVIYNKFGRLYLKIGKIDGAISLLEKAVESGTIDENLFESLANAYLEKGRYTDAIALYEKIISQRPSNKRVLRSLGELYTRINNFESASFCYYQMLNEDPEVINEVTEKIENLARIAPNSTFIHEKLAEVYLRSLKPTKAVIELKRILKLDESKINAVLSLLRKLLQTYPEEKDALFLLSQCLIDCGEYSEAAEILSKLQNSDPSFAEKCVLSYNKIIELYPKQSVARKCLGDFEFSRGNIKKAMQHYLEFVKFDPSEIPYIEKKCREALKADPQMIEPCLVLAECFLMSQDCRKAITLAEELVQKDKDNFEAYRILAEAYSKIDLLGRAKDALRNALRIKPFDNDIQNKFKLISEKELEREISSIRSKIQQDPWRIGLNLDLARLLYKKGSLDSAARALQNALKDTTKVIPSHKLMGIIFKEQGRFDLALLQFEKMLGNKPDLEAEKVALSQIASCYEALGNISSAIDAFEKVLSQDVDFEGIPERLKTLKNINPFFIRNKVLAAYIEIETQQIKAIFGKDVRRHKNDDEDLVSVTFGQEQNNLGFEKFLRDKAKEAEEDFKIATQLDPTLLPSQNNLAVAKLKNKDFENAKMILDNLLIEDATSPIYLNNMGVYYLLNKEIDLAEKHFISALKHDKNFDVTIYNLSQIWIKNGKQRDAFELYKRISPNNPLYESIQRKFYYF